MKDSLVTSYETYPFVKKYVLHVFGEEPFANMNTLLAAEIVQAGINGEKMCRLDIHLSARLFQLKPVVFEPLYLRTFYAMMVAFVEAQRMLKVQKKDAIANYILFCGLTEDDLSLEKAIKMYDRNK